MKLPGMPFRSRGALASPTVRTARAHPGVTVHHNFQAGHGWTFLGGVTGALNATDANHAAGSQCAWFQGNGNNSVVGMRRVGATAVDLTGRDLGLLIRVDEPNRIDTGASGTLLVYIGNGTFTNFLTLSLGGTGSQKFFPRRSTSGNANGGYWQYVTIPIDGSGTLPPHMSKTGTQTVAQILANVTDWQVYHRDPAASTPARIAVQEIFSFPKQTTYPNGVACLTFDDAYASTLTLAAPILAGVGGRGTAYLIRDALGTNNYLTVAQAQQLQNRYGWACASHADAAALHNGNGFIDVSANTLAADAAAQRRWMALRGLRAYNHTAYPHGNFSLGSAGEGTNDSCDLTLATPFATARSLWTQLPETIPPADRMKLRPSVNLTAGSSLATAQAAVDKAKRAQAPCIIVFHDIVSANATSSQWLASDLQSLVTYIAAAGMPLRTIPEVF